MLTDSQLASIEEDLTKPIADPNAWARRAVSMLLEHAREMREELTKRGATIAGVDQSNGPPPAAGPEYLSRWLQLAQAAAMHLTDLAVKGKPASELPVDIILDDAKRYADGLLAREKLPRSP